MRNQTGCFTGHRNIPPDQCEVILSRLEATIVELISRGYRYFGTGGALGFDTMAAQVVLKLRKVYPHIRLILVLPCMNQTRRWKESDIVVYESIKAQADKVVYISQEYTPDCMRLRNRHLIDNSSVCVA